MELTVTSGFDEDVVFSCGGGTRPLQKKSKKQKTKGKRGASTSISNPFAIEHFGGQTFGIRMSTCLFRSYRFICPDCCCKSGWGRFKFQFEDEFHFHGDHQGVTSPAEEWCDTLHPAPLSGLRRNPSLDKNRKHENNFGEADLQIKE